MRSRSQSWMFMPWPARALTALVISSGLFVMYLAAWRSSISDPLQFLVYLTIAVIASRLKVRLPGITASLSVNFLFMLLALVEFGFAETLAISGAAALAQELFDERPRPLHLAFQVCSVTTAAAAAYNVFHFTSHHLAAVGFSLPLLLAVSVFFVANTLPTAVLSSWTEQSSLRKIWPEFYFWTFPYYLVGGGLAGFVSWLNHAFSWQAALLVLPVVYVVYRSYRLYLDKLASERGHVEQMASLHLRTIEALALAIEAKDQTSHAHLQRIRLYAVEIARKMLVPAEDIQAIQAAALLHDIGKLAIPEHITAKPGRLTPEEFEKVKIHPLVGAEILERVQFPYPVVPIVRAHHERWDGAGYPLGLRGEEIPMGARILAAVDFLDALATDRQYRRALPLEEIMRRLNAESGAAFDPRVVKVLQDNYADLERWARLKIGQMPESALSVGVQVTRGAAPATGFEETHGKKSERTGDTTFLASIAAARQEAQTLFELTQELGASLSLDETLSVFCTKLERLVPYDSIAVYIKREGHLVPQYASGENFRFFAALPVPLGEGVSGWVAQNRKPIVNGNPTVEPGYPRDTERVTPLRSALSVPLEGVSGLLGVLTLYRAEKDGFNMEHLRILQAITSKVSLSIENALKYQQAENSATTDYLTELPNARSLFLHLDREIARCRRSNTTLTLVLGDLNGFKLINDRHGHLEGNQVLRLFAKRLRETCREYDYIARMGGDEFVLVVPGLTKEGAASRGQQLAQLAGEVGIEVCDEETLSISIGFAVYPENGTDAEGLLAEADRAMYLAKQLFYAQQPVPVSAANPPSRSSGAAASS